MDAAVHDAILARVSHLPHLVAYALVDAVAGARVGGRRVLDYAGSGLRDTTRIAASPAELWRDIALANAAALRARARRVPRGARRGSTRSSPRATRAGLERGARGGARPRGARSTEARR